MTDFFNLLFTFPLIYAITNPPDIVSGDLYCKVVRPFDPVIII